MNVASVRAPSWQDQASKTIINVFVVALAAAAFIVFIIGSYDTMKNVEPNRCEMTYMYEMPQYEKISIGNYIDKRYPAYNLFAYGEGHTFEATQKLKFTGIPVLFVPGNAGSYKQVRSLASVALRKWLDNRTPFHFDFYTLDFNSQYSGLYGYVLESQQEYMKAAIERISSFYKDFQKVILIGHSMGGIVAKSVVDFEESSPYVHLIITMAAPHVHPVVIADPELDLFYYKLKKNWSSVATEGSPETKPTLISIAGGDRDHLVPSKSTRWLFNDIHVVTTGIPVVWLSTDHQCIVWCKQVVFSVVRALFDMVEFHQRNKYYTITEDPELKKTILEYHFVKKYNGKSYYGAHDSKTPMDVPSTNVFWTEILQNHYCVNATSKSVTYVMLPIRLFKQRVFGLADGYKVVIMSTNSEPKNWVFGCTDQTITNSIRYCSNGDDLSEGGELVPHGKRLRKLIQIEYTKLMKYSHVIVKMEPSQFKNCMSFEIYNKMERRKTVGSRLESPRGNIFYNLTMPSDGILSRLFVWKAFIHSVKDDECQEGGNSSLAIFQHGNFRQYKVLRNESLLVRFIDWSVPSGNILVYLNSRCKHIITLKFAPLETAGQLFRTYARFLPAFFASIVLMSMSYQNSTDWNNFVRILLTNAYQLSIIPGILVSVLLSALPNDWPHLIDAEEFSILVPIFCYMIAYALVLLVSAFGWYSIIMFGKGVHPILLRLVKSRIGPYFKWTIADAVTDYAVDFVFSKFPVMFAVLLLSISVSTCGSFGFLATLVFYLIKIFGMYENLLSDLWKGKLNNAKEGLSPLNFHFTCAMLWFILVLWSVPGLMHWVKSPTTDPQWDLSMYLCLMVLPAIAVLWQNFAPKFQPLLWLVHRYVFYFMGLAVVVWGTHRLYITAFIVNLVLITLAICVLISKIVEMKNNSEVEPSGVTQEPIEGEETRRTSASDESQLSEDVTDEELLSPTTTTSDSEIEEEIVKQEKVKKKS